MKPTKTVAIIVAHPDDETLWAGGTILSHPSWNCFIISLCRASDTDRAPRFYKALSVLKADGAMGDLNDNPEQTPLNEKVVEQAILNLLPEKQFDLIISHSPHGEYTKHLRHEEISRAVLKLWESAKIVSTELWLFAYEDGEKKYLPRPISHASIYKDLTKHIWRRKYSLITETYGFDKNSWEAAATPKAEAFWKFTDPMEAKKWTKQK